MKAGVACMARFSMLDHHHSLLAGLRRRGMYGCISPHLHMHTARRAASRRAAGTIGRRGGRRGRRATEHELLRPAQQQQQQRAGLREPQSNLRSICTGLCKPSRRCFHVALQ